MTKFLQHEKQLLKITSYTRQEKLKQGKSCVVILLSQQLVAKLFYDELDAYNSFCNQLYLWANDLATKVWSAPICIKLNNESTGGLSGEYWYYICDYAQPIRGMNTNRVLLAIKNKLKKVSNLTFDLYTLDNVGIYDGKLVLLDCLGESW